MAYGATGRKLSRVTSKTVAGQNRRMYHWIEFITWVLRPLNWSTKKWPSQKLTMLAELRAEIASLLRDQWQQPQQSKQREGFTADEIAAIEAAIGPGSDGKFSLRVFASHTRPRNWALYSIIRDGGIRRGEALVVQIGDLPRPITVGGVRHYVRAEVDLVRRPDDAEDPRVARAPGLKRGGRPVALSDRALDAIWDYIKAPSPSGKGTDHEAAIERQYLITTKEGVPISVDTAHGIARSIRRYASLVFEERHPGVPHSLNEFCWHRLRHHRALEVLEAFQASGMESLDEFLEYFGWGSVRSAKPYIRRLLSRRANERVLRLQAGDV
jgi:hypothetical protein